MKDNRPSFSQNEQNSGFIGWTAGGDGIITMQAYQRYNLLIAKYGDKFLPPLSADAGITRMKDYCTIDKEHLVKFAQMNRWWKEEKQ